MHCNFSGYLDFFMVNEIYANFLKIGEGVVLSQQKGAFEGFFILKLVSALHEMPFMKR
jgi:hypothetical protein